MTDIDILIHKLHSDDLEQRYFAVKSLREQDQLPLEAVNALQIASDDPEPLVSAAAHMALLDFESRSDSSYAFNEPYPDFERPYSTREIITGLILGTVIVLLTIPLINIIIDDRLNDLWFVSLPAILIAGYISHLSFKDSRQRPLITILSSLAVGLLSGIILYLLFSGVFLLAVNAYIGY
jgi:hypothetical protein